MQTLKTYKQAVNPSNRKGLVFMFHGLNSRVGHGSHIAKFLANEGYEVVGFDHRGLGTSQKTSTVEGVNFSSHIQDSTTFINKIKAQYPTSTKYYALGLSLGGLTSFHLASNFRAVILMAPAIQKIQ
jgi:acylglycerol lipase